MDMSFFGNIVSRLGEKHGHVVFLEILVQDLGQNMDMLFFGNIGLRLGGLSSDIIKISERSCKNGIKIVGKTGVDSFTTASLEVPMVPGCQSNLRASPLARSQLHASICSII